MLTLIDNQGAPIIRSNWPWGIILLLLLILVIFWQIPGTIALRHIAFFLLLALLVFLQIHKNLFKINYRISVLLSEETSLLITLSGWMLLVITVYSPVQSIALAEFRGQWLIPMACWIAGTLMALTADAYSRVWCQRIVTLIFYGLLSQILLHDILDIWFWVETGVVPFRQAPIFYLPEIFKSFLYNGNVSPGFKGTLPDKFSYVNNTCAALLIAEIVQRLVVKKPFLPIGRVVIGLAVAAILLCSFLLRMRNGNIGLLLLIAMTGIFVLVRISSSWHRIKANSIAVMFILMLVLFGWITYKSDDRWLALAESVEIAFDTEKHKAWLDVNAPTPLMQNGSPVDRSAYERLAWFKEGAKLIQDHPLGFGYNRNAFGVGIEQAYQQVPRSLHAHSGLIDFTIGNGIPALLLWLLFLAIAAITGWRTFAGGNVALGLMLMFLVSSFFGRSVLDSNMRDHILQQFMFLSGLFYTFCRNRNHGGSSCKRF